MLPCASTALLCGSGSQRTRPKSDEPERDHATKHNLPGPGAAEKAAERERSESQADADIPPPEQPILALRVHTSSMIRLARLLFQLFGEPL